MNPDIQKTLKHNIIVNILDGGFFGFAIGFASFVTILPLFVSTMTDSATLIGLIPAIHNTGWQLPQLLTVRYVARQTRYKPATLRLTIQERLPFLGLALIAWFLPGIGKQTALILTFAMITWQSLGAGFTATAWQSLIGKIFPSEYRGTFFGLQSAAANLLASISAILAGVILERRSFPSNFTINFLLCSVAMLISWIMLALTREAEAPPTEVYPSPSDFWGKIHAILKRDHNLRWFLLARSISQFGIMAFSFYTVYAVRKLGVGEAQAGWMTGIYMGIQIVFNPIMGWLGDRWSRRGVMEIGLLAGVISALLASWAPSSAWFYLVFVLAGIANIAIWTIGLSMILDLGGEAERPAYIGIANSLVAPANILAPFLGGWLADHAGFSTTFIASALGGIVALLTFQFGVRSKVHKNIA